MEMEMISTSRSDAELDKFITLMTDEEFDKRIIQLRRLKVEKARLSAGWRDPETSLIKRLEPTLLGAISVPAYDYKKL